MSLKKNIIANYLGQGWVALMSIAFVPVYIKYLGIEAYGLVGIFAMLQAWLSLLDMGMTPALSRELARFTGGAHDAQSINDLLRSIEIIGTGIALVIAFVIWLASSWLASDWLQVGKLPVVVVSEAIAIMGVVTAMRFVENIYRSSIVGLQKQVLLNIITSLMATLRSLGAVGVLVWVSPTISAFFIWQGLISAFILATFALVTHTTLPRPERVARFSFCALKTIWHFAGGMLGITLLSVLFAQMDKILLSKMLSLSDFGYYTLATVIATSLYTITAPIIQAYSPKFAVCIALNDKDSMIKLFHQSAQIVSVFMGSAAVMLIFKGEHILQLWTQDPNLVKNVAKLLSILTFGYFLSCLICMPYQMQFAYGLTRLAIIANLISAAYIIPVLSWTVPRFGAEGAAWTWVILNLGLIFISVQFLFKRTLPDEKKAWYTKDIFIPIISEIIMFKSCAFLLPEDGSMMFQLFSIFLTGLLTIIAGILFAPEIRHTTLTLLRNVLRMASLPKPNHELN